MSTHPIVHIEIAGKDPKASAEFYAKVFGWKIESDPKFDYTMFAVEPGPGGGLVKVDDEMYKPGDVVPYIATGDIEVTLAQVEAAGGKTLVPKTEIPGIGWFAFFSDVGGTRMALFTSMNPQG